MADKEAQCAWCKNTYPIRVMRFVHNAAGKWVYLCSECRALKKMAEVDKVVE